MEFEGIVSPSCRNLGYRSEITWFGRNLENNAARGRDQNIVVGIAGADIGEVYDR
jgi:hypothetical protein